MSSQAPPERVTPLAVATGVFLLLAFLFRLEWVFPALNHVVPVPPDRAGLADDTVVVTYCALCRTGLAFRSEVAGPAARR
ncbi:MAG: hypothetical protein ACOCZB_03730 [Spirochaetota bacterium]